MESALDEARSIFLLEPTIKVLHGNDNGKYRHNVKAKAKANTKSNTSTKAKTKVKTNTKAKTNNKHKHRAKTNAKALDQARSLILLQLTIKLIISIRFSHHLCDVDFDFGNLGTASNDSIPLEPTILSSQNPLTTDSTSWSLYIH